MDIKTQTRRSTQFKDKLINLNCWVEKGFECGFVTSKYWGDFEPREDPLIELEVDDERFNIPLKDFKQFVKAHLRKWKNWDYTQEK